MIKEQMELMAEHHMVRHVFTDHFGHRHEVKYPTHVAKDADPKQPWPAGEVMLEPFDAEPQLKNIRGMMELREKHFLEHCLEHPVFRHDARVLSHPEHPNNKTQAPALSEDVEGYGGCCK